MWPMLTGPDLSGLYLLLGVPLVILGVVSILPIGRDQT